jgi:UDP-glucose 6-dehydrogenase
MATIIIDIDTDLAEDVQGLVEAVTAVSSLITFQTVVRSSMEDTAAFKSDAVRAAIWLNDKESVVNNPEYVRGQAEAIADTFGGDKEALIEAINRGTA